MSTQIAPAWFRLCEQVFEFSFVAFTFVMFSSCFPSGFSATFSTFSFLFALLVFFIGWPESPTVCLKNLPITLRLAEPLCGVARGRCLPEG